MTNRINNQNIRQVGQSSQNLNKQKINRNAERFSQIYQREITDKNEIKLSAHAKQRLKQRNIELSEADMNALSRGMQKAEEKGGRESLLLYKDLAFIASVRNRTLITAVDQNETKENVFTNIDSAVIIEE
jgi:flagellar operon protein